MPNNYNYCGNCPYINQGHLPQQQCATPSIPLNIDYGSNADVLLIFQAPGLDEWTGNTLSKRRIPIDSNNSHSAAARIRNSMRRNGANRNDYDITEAVQCFPGRNSKGRDKKPSTISVRCCMRHLVNDLSQKKYTQIIAFGSVAYQMATDAVGIINTNTKIGLTQPTPKYAPHPSGGVTNAILDSSY